MSVWPGRRVAKGEGPRPLKNLKPALHEQDFIDNFSVTSGKCPLEKLQLILLKSHSLKIC